jgi:predicted protein tyrosine phosphatase
MSEREIGEKVESDEIEQPKKELIEPREVLRRPPPETVRIRARRLVIDFAEETVEVQVLIESEEGVTRSTAMTEPVSDFTSTLDANAWAALLAEIKTRIDAFNP